MKTPFLHTRFLLSETDHRRLPTSDSEVTFIGRANAKKGSAINWPIRLAWSPKIFFGLTPKKGLA